MQLVNDVQFLNVTLLVLFPSVSAAAMFAVDTLPLTSICASLLSHRLYINIVVLNLIHNLLDIIYIYHHSLQPKLLF